MSHLDTPLNVTNQQCPTPQHLQAELEEETWDKMEKALIRFAGVTRGGGYKHLPLFTDGIGRKGCASKVAECVCPSRPRKALGCWWLINRCYRIEEDYRRQQ
jgi:hypothetical protein